MIYFIRRASDGAIKVGTTIRLSQRLVALRCEHGDCELLAVMDGSYADEKAIHCRFRTAGLWIEGEWFSSLPDLMEFIAAEGRPWDGVDEVPLGRMVRMDDELCEKARKLAALREMSMAEMFTEWLRPIVSREWTKEVKKLKENGDET